MEKMIDVRKLRMELEKRVVLRWEEFMEIVKKCSKIWNTEKFYKNGSFKL